MNQNFDLAKAYLIEANNDFDVVSLLLEEAVVPLEENESRMESVFDILVPFLKINYNLEV